MEIKVRDCAICPLRDAEWGTCNLDPQIKLAYPGFPEKCPLNNETIEISREAGSKDK